MRLSEIEKKAKRIGLTDTWKYNKKELIKEIQLKEGNSPCFASRKNRCEQSVCCWREECLR